MQATFDGQGSLKPDGVALAGQATAKTNNAALALVLMGLEASPAATGVPLELGADLAKTGQSIDLQAIAGQIAGQAVQGSAHFDLSGDKTRFALKANAGSVSLPSLLGSLVAWQRTPSTEEVLGAIGNEASQVWPARGFALQPLETAEGAIELNAKTLALGAPFQIEDAVLMARVDQNEGLSITDLKGTSVRRLLRRLGDLVAEGRRRAAQGPRPAHRGQARSADRRVWSDACSPKARSRSASMSPAKA